MKYHKVACIQENGVDLIIFPLDTAFGHKSLQEKKKVISYLQALAWTNGISGRVVPVWDAGDGKMDFIADRGGTRGDQSPSIRN